MAVNKVPQGSRMVITVQTGVSASNQPTYRQRAYKNVKASAVDSDIYAIGEGLAKLQKYPVMSISRFDEGALVNA